MPVDCDVVRPMHCGVEVPLGAAGHGLASLQPTRHWHALQSVMTLPLTSSSHHRVLVPSACQT